MVEIIRLSDATGSACNPITKFSELTITEILNTVYTIELEVPVDDPVSKEIKIEGFLECDDKRFTIKEITQRLDDGTIGVYGIGECDGLKYTRVKQFSVSKATVGEALDTLLNGRGTGWSWVYGNDVKPTAKRTLTLTKADAGSVWAIVQRIIEKWNVEIYFDCVAHKMIVYKARRLGQQSALTVFYEDLNLNDFERTANSDDVYNEIIAYGKNDLTVKGAKREDGTIVDIKNVNEVNDLGRSERTIPKVMRGYYLDTQEDDVQELYDAAVEYLEKHCYTEKQYTINVADLSEINPNYAEFYRVNLGDTIGISSKTLDVRYNLRVVKITRKLNEVGSMELELTNRKVNTALSTAQERRIVNSMIDTYHTPVVGDTILVGDGAIDTGNIVVDAITSELIKNGAVTPAKMGEQTIDKLIESTLEGVQENLSNAPDGRLQILFNDDGAPIGIKIMNQSNPNLCWVWDFGGLRFSADGGQTFRNVAIDYAGNIVASNLVSGAVLSNAVTAKNLKIEGGSISITSASETESLLKFNWTYGSVTLTPSSITFENNTGKSVTITPIDISFRNGEEAVNQLVGYYDGYLLLNGYEVLTGNNVTKYAADKAHTHSGYALTGHTHSGYAASSHTHSKLAGTTDDVILTGAFLRPLTTNGTVTLGGSSYRWNVIYAKTGTINTSDLRQKHSLDTNMDKYIAMLDRIEPTSYVLNDDENESRHVGYIAQKVWLVMKEVGLEESDFAGFIRDMQDEGSVYTYGLIYSEFIPILHAKMKQLEQRIEEQDQRIKLLEKAIEEQQQKNKTSKIFYPKR